MMEIMRTFILVFTIWMNYASAQGPRRPPPPPRPPPPLPPIKKTSTFDLNQPTTYRTFIKDVRNNLAEKDAKGKYVLKCSMQKIGKVVPAEKYMYVKLIGFSPVTITLALDLSDAYVIGYMDRFNNKDRAFFFSDVYAKPASEIANVFPDTSVTDNSRLDLGYTGNYGDLEKYASRENTPLGITQLASVMKDIYGKKIDKNNKKDFKKFQKNQGKFLLMVVQMVSEAARFKYISDKIPQVKDGTMEVDEKVIALENGWSPLSKAVYESKPSTTTTTKCVLSKKPVSISLGQGKVWEFNSVEEIEHVIELLKAEGNSFFTHYYYYYYYYDNNEDNDAVQFW